MTDIPKSRAKQLVMQPLNCISFLLGLAILSATLGPFVAIAHRELLSVTGSKGGAEIKLELSVDKIRTDEEVRSNVLTGRRMAFGNAVMEQKETKNSGSRTSSGENKNYSTNSHVPSNIKDSSSSGMQAGPSRNRVKLEGSTSVTALSNPNPQHLRTLPSKHLRNSNSGSKNELRDSVVHRTLYKEKMLEASDEVLKFLNKDYHASPHKRKPVHN
ncbi:hypothetical protein BDA96_10G260100 [Sorghum bicolor]|uniref:Uncharacterized protein n=2 Tax=Sorghum bicolor TaxID=4558 RepID=A0A194YKB4_SORBI|nr:uncharacterized protein LOC110430961 [Sorghum bicolor]KAG0515221.1 hypothetical protein BDA96_10G260100 [Sorghum bicolor]KXG20425.1 hypothetical protein SORBI_3010G199500 [Sorghum bicolor]|eukprot:XP_021304934.1 uncharacterized protein LOC110430961 [Sorghum bicolor]